MKLLKDKLFIPVWIFGRDVAESTRVCDKNYNIKDSQAELDIGDIVIEYYYSKLRQSLYVSKIASTIDDGIEVMYKEPIKENIVFADTICQLIEEATTEAKAEYEKIKDGG